MCHEYVGSKILVLRTWIRRGGLVPDFVVSHGSRKNEREVGIDIEIACKIPDVATHMRVILSSSTEHKALCSSLG